MTGSIQEIEKGRLYRVQVECGFDPATGKRVRMVKRVHGTRKDAERVRAAMLVQSGSPVRQRMTLDQFWETLYIPDCEGRLFKSTIQGYENHYKVLVKPFLGGLWLDRITPPVVASWLAVIDGQSRKFEGFKLLRQILNKAVRWDLLESNPCSRTEVPKRPSAYEPETLPAEFVPAYLDAFRGTDVEAAVLIALGGGLRRSEIAALDWEDFDGSSITVDDAITSIGGKPHDGDTKSRFSKRTVHLPASICERLEDLRGSGAVLKDTDGNRMNPDNLTHRYERVVRKLPEGVPRVSLKNLRHTSLTLALQGGAELLTVSRRAGHSNVNITARYYLRPDSSVDVAAAAGLDGLFNAAKRAKTTPMAPNGTRLQMKANKKQVTATL